MSTLKMNFPLRHHATMLADHLRLERFRNAIKNQVGASDTVAEIGTGTGILASYAASCTNAQVFAIEYFESTLAVAQAIFENSNFKNVQLIKGRSYDTIIDPSPKVLITETIGRIGPEENIVEICYDFKRRHPLLEKIIPAKISLYAEPIVSPKIATELKKCLQSYDNASHNSFDYQSIRNILLQSYSLETRFTDLSDARVVGPRTCLTTYLLGETKSSAFSKTIDLDRDHESTIDGVHIYFEAHLDHSVVLSTHYGQPLTHWLHAYLPCASGSRRVQISYIPGSQSLQAEWF